MKKKILIIVTNFLIILIIVVLYALYRFNYIPHKKYTNEDFNIKTYISKTDKDNDGIDDQTDILNNVRDYIMVKLPMIYLKEKNYVIEKIFWII